MRRNLIPLILMLIGAFLLLFAGIWYLEFLREPSEKMDIAPSIVDNVSNVPRISLTTAKTSYDKNEAIFVDVRELAEFEQSHIPGARSIPLADLPNRLNELDPSVWIITY